VFSAPKSPLNPKGDRHIDERRVLAHLKKILQKLNLPGHLHTFRHSFISHTLMMGTPETVVRQWVGHVDVQVLKLYTHIADSQSKRFMERLSKPEEPNSEAGNNGKPADAAGTEDVTPTAQEEGGEAPEEV
jgi:integrase